MTNRQKVQYRQQCIKNIKEFFRETTLHGLKFVADSSITIWERIFFLCAFVIAFFVTINLISNIYAKWDSTPVIIGISPHPTSILKMPFPAVTVCNMNQVLRKQVSNYSRDSYEAALLELLCFTDIDTDPHFQNSLSFRNNELNISDFVVKNAQPCSKLLLSCKFSASFFNCSDLFTEIITDEGLCCAFNVVHSEFLYKGNYNIIKELTSFDGSVPTDWSPESGYPPQLPEKYYPRPATGTGVAMGLQLTLNADLNEYYCSSTNGPGFKITLHNPIETPHIKETGLTVPVGFETRFRIDAIQSGAVENIRSINQNARQCVFENEKNLLYYKHYTRRNCERECLTSYIHESCSCIPHNMPLVFTNASMCTAKDSFCINAAEKEWMGQPERPCRKRCLPSCFDLSYLPDSFSVPLADRNYIIPDKMLRAMPKNFLKTNIAVIHIYYRESVFYGDLKNVYIGLTEFLSNTGGIMGLFMGFSFISVVEILYFLFLRPVFEILLKNRQIKKAQAMRNNEKP